MKRVKANKVYISKQTDSYLKECKDEKIILYIDNKCGRFIHVLLDPISAAKI